MLTMKRYIPLGGGMDAAAGFRGAKAAWPPLLCALVLALVLAGCGGGGGGKEAKATDFKYEMNKAGDGVIITGYQKNAAGGALVIPAKIEGLPVVAFAVDPMMGFNETRDLPRTDAEIKAKGLHPRITSVVFPDSITSITDEEGNDGTPDRWGNSNHCEVFVGCIALKSISFPKNLKVIPMWMARDCPALTTVKWPENLERINSGAFQGAGFTELVIPEGVTYIGDDAFRGCEKLTSLTLPESLQEIGDTAFFDCKSLTTVKMPSHPIKYGEYGNEFNGCKLDLASQKAIKDTGYTGKF